MIYFIKNNTGDGFIKIGYTKRNIRKRISALQTASPAPLTLLAGMPGGLDKEKILHAKFKKYRVHGEWFKVVPEIIEYINNIPVIDDINLLNEISDEVIEEKLNESMLSDILEEVEIKFIKYAINKFKTLTQAADVLGITLRSIRYRVEKYNLK